MIPTVVGLAFGQFAPLVDSLCISKILEEDALSAMSTVNPVYYLFNIVAVLGGIGGGIGIAKSMGTGNKYQGGRIFTKVMIFLTAATAVLSVLCLIFIDPLLKILCATERNYGYARDYLAVLLMGMVFYVLNNALVYILMDDNDADPKNTVKADRIGSLSHNTNEYLDELKREPLGNVLLTGATGFLGIHVLRELIENTDEKVYCLVHSGKVKAEHRLKDMLYYYFETTYDELFGERLFVVEGDITHPETFDSLSDAEYSTVINCAACVKHFADIEYLKSINYKGVENLTELCLKTGSRLIHISTVSVAGSVEEENKDKMVLREDMLDIGQEVEDNGYVYTKYLAEKHVLKCIEEKNLDAKIIRVGNLSSRVRDGEFQVNFRTNAFMNSLKAYAVLGCFPISSMSEKKICLILMRLHVP
ncbi:MAG: SDR family oxidoreductase [Lachnospiraceae bacterium]|nr:SDR family oxidoreductase [Lachnospiraceae bacterium]